MSYASDFESLVEDMRKHLFDAKTKNLRDIKKADAAMLSKVRKVAKKHGIPSNNLFMDVTNRAIQLGV